MSGVINKTWRVNAGGMPAVRSVPALKELLLQQRGLTMGAPGFFDLDYERDIHDPCLLHDMAVAIDRIFHAIKAGEHIVVHGDYDADGITSTAILVSALQDLGGRVTPFLPDRHGHGYGLHQDVLADLVSGVGLLIACDCGISNYDEVAWLKQQGVDTIIIDHHSIPERVPSATAVVHPAHPAGQYPTPWLCGAGVSWKVACALLRDERSPFRKDRDREKWLLDLAAIGTVADVVSVLGENRAIVQFGLEILRRTQRVGLRTLMASARVSPQQLTEEEVAFRIVPRLNAAGRMDHAQPALDLLLTSSERQAEELVTEINTLNQQRQTVTRRVLKEAEAFVTDDPFIFAYDARWPAGVVGLAAGRLADRFARPAIVIGSNGKHAVGSARSPIHVNVLTLLQAGAASLLKLGGHAQAAGFSLEETMIEDFRTQLLARGESTSQTLIDAKEADAVIHEQLLHRDVYAMVQSFAPFGEKNQRPRFVIQGLRMRDWRPVGKTQDHAKLTFQIGDERLDGIGFGLAQQLTTMNVAGGAVDVLGELSENEYRGRRSLQVSLTDIAPTGEVTLVSSEPPPRAGFR